MDNAAFVFFAFGAPGLLVSGWVWGRSSGRAEASPGFSRWLEQQRLERVVRWRPSTRASQPSCTRAYDACGPT